MNTAAPFSEPALTVLRERYLRRDAAGQLAEDPSGMLERVAAAIAAPAQAFGDDPELWEARFLERLQRLEFLPNSPTLMNAGLPGGQLAACFVLPIADDLDAIFTALSRMARIHQTGGGTGFSFSALRPRDDRVRSTGGITSGPRRLGLKGITVYRYGSRPGQTLSLVQEDARNDCRECAV